MKKLLLILLLLPLGVIAQSDVQVPSVITAAELLSEATFMDEEFISKVELTRDTLFVYKSYYDPHSMVLAIGRDNSIEILKNNVRDVYVSKNGRIVFLERQHPTLKTVQKNITVESW